MFSVLDENNCPEESKAQLKQIRDRLGYIPNILGVMAHSPIALNIQLTLTNLIKKTHFSELERQAMYLVFSQENQCGYCVAAHKYSAKIVGASDELLERILHELPLESQRMQSLVSYCRAFARKKGFTTEKERKNLLQAGFEAHHILEINAIYAFKILTTFTDHVANVPVDPLYLS